MTAKRAENPQLQQDILGLAIRLTFGFAIGLIFLATVCGLVLVV
jgi:hypothetical protein